MTSIMHGVPRAVRAGGPQQIQASRCREILESIRWMQREHVKDLRRLGYSAREAFWLNFACLPFLPWDGKAAGEMPLSWVLRLYTDIYRRAFGSLGRGDEGAFVELLRQRYHRMKQAVAASNGAASNAGTPGTGPGPDAESEKAALGGLIVLRTARAWQGHHAAFPCRLVEDL